MLNALNRLYKTHLNMQQLIDIARHIGADVSFFLYHGCKRARGIGESLSNIRYNLKVYYVIVKGEGGVSTSEAYRLYHDRPTKRAHVPSILYSLKKGDLAMYARHTSNMLEGSAVYLQPNIRKAFEELSGAGAEFTMVTGSGSAVFGIYRSRAAAFAAEQQLKEKGCFEFVCMAKGIKSTVDEVLRIY